MYQEDLCDWRSFSAIQGAAIESAGVVRVGLFRGVQVQLPVGDHRGTVERRTSGSSVSWKGSKCSILWSWLTSVSTVDVHPFPRRPRAGFSNFLDLQSGCCLHGLARILSPSSVGRRQELRETRWPVLHRQHAECDFGDECLALVYSFPYARLSFDWGILYCARMITYVRCDHILKFI